MTTEKSSRNINSGKKGGNFLPALCNILGVGILIFCILIALPLSVPKFLGYDAYQIVSGSMEPAIPVQSVIYVKQTEGADVQVGDVIAFYSGSSVVAHRVEENDITNGKFVTKGDANPVSDSVPVRGERIAGKFTRKARFLIWVNSFVSPQKILLLLVMIPMTVIAFLEARSLLKIGKKAAAEGEAERKKRKEARIREAIEAEKRRLEEIGYTPESEVNTDDAGENHEETDD